MKIKNIFLLMVIFSIPFFYIIPSGCESISVPHFDSAPSPSSFLSPNSIIADKEGKTLFIVEKDAHQIRIVDPQSLNTIKLISTPAFPTAAVLSSDQKIIYVAASCPNGFLAAIDITSGKIINAEPSGHSPWAMDLSPDGKTIAVCDRFGGKVHLFSTTPLKKIKTIDAGREPVSCIFTKDNQKLIVTNFMPAVPANQDFIATTVTIIPLANPEKKKSIPLCNGAINARGIELTPDGKFALIPHVLAHYQVDTSMIERGWICTNALSFVDLEKEKLHASILLDDSELGAANPSAVKISPDGKTICTAHSGSHELITLPLDKIIAKIDQRLEKIENVIPDTRPPTPTEYDLFFIREFRTRIPLNINGPRCLTFIGNTVYTPGYYSDELAKVELTNDHSPVPVIRSYGIPFLQHPLGRRGEAYFNDGTKSFQNWISCVSCHPDGRADALNWDLLNDGVGNHKNSKSMLYSIYTPLTMITGIRKNAEVAIRAGMLYIQFHALEENDEKEIFPAIEQYFREMTAVPSPYLLPDGSLSASAQRGEKIFNQVGCNQCHNGKYFTNMKRYKTGTEVASDIGKDIVFDVPSLNEIWRTAPYINDGRTMSIKEAYTTCSKNFLEGKPERLSDEEAKDLINYVLSL